MKCNDSACKRAIVPQLCEILISQEIQWLLLSHCNRLICCAIFSFFKKKNRGERLVHSNWKRWLDRSFPTSMQILSGECQRFGNYRIFNRWQPPSTARTDNFLPFRTDQKILQIQSQAFGHLRRFNSIKWDKYFQTKHSGRVPQSWSTWTQNIVVGIGQ